MVDLDPVAGDADLDELQRLVSNHYDYTGSTPAAWILENWDAAVRQFVKVMPRDYKRVLQAQAQGNGR